MIIILTIVALLLILLVILKVRLSQQFNGEVKQLFARSEIISDKKFSYSQLSGLPLPVQLYFKHVLKEGQPYISYARLMHDGKFKAGLNKKWISIRGSQYFTAGNPGFIWKGITSMFTARDMYIAGNGRLVVTIFGLIKVVDAQGENFNEAELQRWIAESVWFPTSLLPSERIQWSGVDANQANLHSRYGKLSLLFVVTFNAAAEIAAMETKRFMDKGKKEDWVCTMTNYKEAGGILIPFNAEASWKLATGDCPYARFSVKKIEYNKPELF